MARVSGRRSDKSGDLIPPKTGAIIRIAYWDGTTTARRADLTDEEVAELVELLNAQEIEPRPERRRSRADL